MDPRLLLGRHVESLQRTLERHQQALNDGQHRCCNCGTPASIQEPHCTYGHQRASQIIEQELAFDRETRRLIAERASKEKPDGEGL